MFDVNYRTRINKSNLEARRNEIDLRAGAPALQLNTRYVYFDRQEGSEFPGREEISGGLSSHFNQRWRSSLNATRDLVENDLRTMKLDLTYEDECLVFSTNFTRSFFENNELQPEDSIFFRILFKTLGEVSPGVL